MSSSILRAIVARGGFNPLTDIPSAAYWDMHTPDAAYETLPGNTLATAQNDGIGAVLDLKRYKERGANVVTQDGSAWTAFGSSPNQWTISGDTASVDNTGGTTSCYLRHAVSPLTAGRLYAVTFTVLSSNGVGGVRAETATDNVPDYITSTGTHTVLLRAVGAAPSQFQFQANVGWVGSIDLSTVEVREIPGYHAIQSLATAQPVLNIENGIRSALFDGVDDRLVVPNSTDQFNFLHNGQGGELHACARVTDMSADRMLVANNSGSSTGAGIDLRIRPNGIVRFAVTRGIAGEQSALNLPAGSAVAGEIAVWGIRYDVGIMRVYKNGVEAGAAAQSYPPVAADAQLDLTIGGPSPASGTFRGDIYSIAPVQGTLSDYQRQRLAAYMLRRAGV